MMMKGKKKFYVVWTGRNPGIFDTWEACQAQVLHVEHARFKSFPTRAEAETAFAQPAPPPAKKALPPSKKNTTTSHTYIADSIAVDGAWNTKTGVVEYQGVFTKTKEVLFLVGPYEDGTNNIAEFLALVHALAYVQKHHLTLPIYTDSRTALSWVKRKKANTTHPRTQKNKPLFELVDRAIHWLNTHTYATPILKWETERWGENPADFGRK